MMRQRRGSDTNPFLQSSDRQSLATCPDQDSIDPQARRTTQCLKLHGGFFDFHRTIYGARPVSRQLVFRVLSNYPVRFFLWRGRSASAYLARSWSGRCGLRGFSTLLKVVGIESDAGAGGQAWVIVHPVREVGGERSASATIPPSLRYCRIGPTTSSRLWPPRSECIKPLVPSASHRQY